MRLALEARAPFRIRGAGRRPDLDRDLALQLRIAGAVDLANADSREDLIGADAPAGQ
jgi:hypothetical protein